MGKLNDACGINKLIVAFVMSVIFGFLAYVFNDKYAKQGTHDDSKTNYYLMISCGIIGGVSFLYFSIMGTVYQFSKSCRETMHKYQIGEI